MKPGQETKVFRLLKCLYGLKQAGCSWHQEMTRFFTHCLGFMCSDIDHSIFFRQTHDEHTIIVVATNDMIITSKRPEDITKFKSQLKQHWDISDLGEIHWYLGFEVKRDRKAWTILIN